MILYELLTGQLPFNAAAPAELARLHKESPPPSPRRANPEIPPELEQIILKVLAKEPSARYRTGDQLGRVLYSYQQRNEGVEFVPPGVARTIPPPASPEAKVYEKAKAGEDHTFDIDWITVGLGLLTVIAVGGLIPFWLAIWFYLNPITP